ncbi:cobalamin-dependent protein [Streptomyces sp. NPDC017673]|uniref:cobalamin-dependent protein n=1 Tax=unclassified Streptomyces TaxID=2593676 RepID=UPI0037B06B93
MFVSVNKLKSFRPVLPIGMVTVATQVRAAGHDVHVLDLMWEEEDEKAVREAVAAFRPDVVGISIRNVDSQNMLEPVIYTPLAREVADWARAERPGVTVVLGGPGFSTVPDDLMDFVGAEYGITGFAEESMVPFLAHLRDGTEPADVPGVIFRAPDGSYHRRDPVFEIDYRKAARPDPELYDPRYFTYSYETHDRSEKVPATIQTKKGCVLECVFCSNFLVDGTGVKFDDVKRVADEVERLRDEGLEVLEIVDGVFNLPLNYAVEVLREFVRRGIEMPWSCMINPGNVTPELVDLMVRTGCYYVEFGTDSCNDRVLRRLKKNFRQRQVISAHRRFEQAGIRVEHCLFIGSPGDDRDSVRETFDVMSGLVPPRPTPTGPSACACAAGPPCTPPPSRRACSPATSGSSCPSTTCPGTSSRTAPSSTRSRSGCWPTTTGTCGGACAPSACASASAWRARRASGSRPSSSPICPSAAPRTCPSP